MQTALASSTSRVAFATRASLHRPVQRQAFAAQASLVRRRSGASVVVRASSQDSDVSDSTALAAAAVTLPANAIMAWSVVTLFQTGAGLPPGPGGALGAAEGLSYLAVTGLVGWSLFTKVKTGSGLPAGPGGALGAAEGISYLTLLAAIAVAGAKAAGL